MKLEINHFVSIEIADPYELVELMSDEEQVELIESLSCFDAVIVHVKDQLLHGCTVHGNHGSIGPDTPLSMAVREVAELCGEVAKSEIASLERRLKYQEELNSELHADLHNLQRQLRCPL